MSLTAFRESRPGTRLIFTGFVVLVVFLITQFLAAIVAIPIFGFDALTGMMDGINHSDPESLKFLKFFQISQTIGLFILPPLVLAWFFHPDIMEYLSLRRKPTIILSLMVFLLVLVISPFINYTGAINAEMHFPEWLSGVENWMRNAEDTAEQLVEAFLKVNGIGGLMFNLFMIAVLPALGEELLFRGVIQKLFTGMSGSHHWGIWLSAALFSALHMQFYGFIPRMLLGGMFGYLLVWSQTLWLPILAHFINNSAAVILMYMVDHDIISQEVEEFGTGPDGWMVALGSLVVGGFIFYWIKRQASRESVPEIQP